MWNCSFRLAKSCSVSCTNITLAFLPDEWQLSYFVQKYQNRSVWRSAAILSLVLDFILSGSTLSPIDYIQCLVGLLVFYRCVHIWSHNATILKIWKIMVRTTATPQSVWLLNGYIQVSCFGHCQFNSHTYWLIGVVILIILIIYWNITAVLQLFAVGFMLIIGNTYECVVQ